MLAIDVLHGFEKAGGGRRSEPVGLPGSRSWAQIGRHCKKSSCKAICWCFSDSLLRIGGISKYLLFLYTLMEETYSSCQWILNINKFISFDAYAKVHP
jgi:hypothetical protein